VIKPPNLKQLGITGLAASIAISIGSIAGEIDPVMPAIVDSGMGNFPADMADWIANPAIYSWNPLNVRLGFHPDRPDPNDPTGQSPGVIYIFPDAATADAWWDGTGPVRTGIPDTAVAYIHWKLDNGSGQFPGIMAKTDDYDFKTNNCIMSSGTTIPEPQTPGGIEKTCSNPQGSSKRYKLVVMKADEPIDLVFNMTTTPLTYTNYDAADFAPDNDWFRIYRYIMKWGNGTGTDTTAPVGETRDGTRIVGFKVELGYGVGSGFTATKLDDPNTPEDEHEGLEYELRLCIPDMYFDVKSGQSKPGKSDCDPGFVEVWLENEYATFSPSMYSLTTDKRTTPVGGYWDKNPAGIFAPQTQTEILLDSGAGAYVPNKDSFGGDYDPFPPAGQIGQITSNYFDVASSQGAGAGVAFPDNMFGYLMFYGVFANGDTGNISSGIYIDDDGDPATEGSLYAWWDGSSATCCYRWAIDRDFDGTVGPDAWEVIPPENLAWFASRQLDENQVLDPPRYEIGYMDDMGGLNSDTFIRVMPNYDVTARSTFTVRFTAQSVADAGLVAGNKGVDPSPWVANPPMQFADFPDVTPVDPDAPTAPVVPPAADNDSGWCSYNPNGRFDPILPGLLLAGLAYLGWRLKKKSAK